ncbi:hypothetical protein BpHYR1_053271 [Brachionus plicatilis]|uniref:Uncharacterized protein n=1 Tax=Brachionus plicatilis TaxID=10195 RepID=A0A3M7T164_BRAPC|nr:hypothetical protein BpHYR1_053271 [Brachionus plicatilis]
MHFYYRKMKAIRSKSLIISANIGLVEYQLDLAKLINKNYFNKKIIDKLLHREKKIYIRFFFAFRLQLFLN